jgi:hypothetical protein
MNALFVAIALAAGLPTPEIPEVSLYDFKRFPPTEITRLNSQFFVATCTPAAARSRQGMTAPLFTVAFAGAGPQDFLASTLPPGTLSHQPAGHCLVFWEEMNAEKPPRRLLHAPISG